MLLVYFGSYDLIVLSFELFVMKDCYKLLIIILYVLRDFDYVLDMYEKGKFFYLYIGRGLFLEVMYMGYLIFFIFIK